MIPETVMADGTNITARDPVVVLAADEAFAMPLAVTIRSVLDNLDQDRTLHIYVLDGGILPETKERLLRSWADTKPHDVHWLHIDEAALAGLKVSDHVSMAAYYRILASRLLPEHVSRAIYLDSDLVIRSNLGTLWDTDFNGAVCLAVQDIGSPYMESRIALPNYRRAGSFLVAARPIPNYEALGFTPEMPYLNSGVLVLDVDAWRKEDLASKLIDCLHVNQSYIRWWDQYALNVVLARRWGLLDSRWNQSSHLFNIPHWSYSAFNEETVRETLQDPYIIHFNSPDKPWQTGCRHPLRRAFFEYLDRTDWAGWRPPKFSSYSLWWRYQKSRIVSAYEMYLLKMRIRLNRHPY